jgi:regulatory protein
MQPKKKWNTELPSSRDSTAEAEADPSGFEQELYILALKALNRKPYPSIELEKKLLDRSSNRDLVSSVLRRLTANGYLDDRKYIEVFALSRRDRKLQGRSRIENELRAKGLDPDLIKEILEEIYPRAADRDLLALALDKRLKNLTLPMDAKKIARLYNYLFRHGFPAEDIHREISKRFKNDLESE